MQNNKMRLKKVSNSSYLTLALGIVVFALSCVGLSFFSEGRNTFLGFVVVLGWGIGGFMIVYGFKHREAGIIITKEGEAPPVKANAMNIYRDYIAFEEMLPKDLLGQPQRCHNDRKYYNVHIFDEATGKLKAFILPDTQYNDPMELANCLNIPAHRKLAQRRASLIQKIAPFALVAGMGIFAFLQIVFSNPGVEKGG